MSKEEINLTQLRADLVPDEKGWIHLPTNAVVLALIDTAEAARDYYEAPYGDKNLLKRLVESLARYKK